MERNDVGARISAILIYSSARAKAFSATSRADRCNSRLRIEARSSEREMTSADAGAALAAVMRRFPRGELPSRIRCRFAASSFRKPFAFSVFATEALQPTWLPTTTPNEPIGATMLWNLPPLRLGIDGSAGSGAGESLKFGSPNAALQ